jgi:hypothetical protein
MGKNKEYMNGQNGQTLPGYTEKELEPKYFPTLEHIEQIIGYAEALGIEDALLGKASSCIAIVAERLGITPRQAVLFSLLFGRYTAACDHDDLAQLFKCTPVKLLRYMNDLEELQKKKLLARKNRGDRLSFQIPLEVVNTLRKKDSFTPETHRDITIDEFFGVLEDLFDQTRDEDMSREVLHEELRILLENNMHLLLCRKLTSYNLDEETLALLLCFCHLFVNNHDDNIGFHDFEFLYDKKSKSRYVFRQFREGGHTLLEAKFIENTNDGGFLNTESFKLTDRAKKELLTELDIKPGAGRRKGMLLWDAITPKELFYNEKEAIAVRELASLLREENFREIRERLLRRGMRAGFVCLFSGGPGTGKTETAYQIARETQRNILLVDISAIKGMYVGETEKHMKAVFDDYRDAVSAAARAPILLFNEADALIGKRTQFTPASRAVERMENTMQNIILQEMENLEGILIATTNLKWNMDKAFERRFLYKIEFENPGRAARRKIWQAMLPGIPEDEAGELASRFDLSGGQIENVVRKCTVAGVLSGTAPSFAAMLSLCADELCAKKTGAAIGFGNS